METPPIFSLCDASSQVREIFSDSDTLRIFPFSYVEKMGFDLQKPYAVFQSTGGSPDNNLSSSPCSDSPSFQIDVYAEKGKIAKQGANAIEKALENNCYITRYGIEGWEKETGLYRVSFETSWILER